MDKSLIGQQVKYIGLGDTIPIIYGSNYKKIIIGKWYKVVNVFISAAMKETLTIDIGYDKWIFCEREFFRTKDEDRIYKINTLLYKE